MAKTATKDSPKQSSNNGKSKGNQLIDSDEQTRIRRETKTKRRNHSSSANRAKTETFFEGLQKDRTADRHEKAETTRTMQVVKAKQSLKLTNDYDNMVATRFMQEWLDATPVYRNGVLVDSRTAIAKRKVKESLPPEQATSKLVSTVLEKAANALFNAGNRQA